jgi:hypothetical protein
MDFYELIDLLKQLIEQNNFTNKITFGDISDVDLNKDTTFPLLHIMLDEAIIEERTIDYRLNIIASDIVDVIDEDLGVDDFYGNDNTQDILNTQLRVVTELVNALRRLDLVSSDYSRIEDAATATPFRDRFENEIAGWETSITLKKFQDGSTSSNSGVGNC